MDPECLTRSKVLCSSSQQGQQWLMHAACCMHVSFPLAVTLPADLTTLIVCTVSALRYVWLLNPLSVNKEPVLI